MADRPQDSQRLPAIPEKAVELVAKRRHPLLSNYNSEAQRHAIEEVHDDLAAALPTLQEAIAERLLSDEALGRLADELERRGWTLWPDGVKTRDDLQAAVREAMSNG